MSTKHNPIWVFVSIILYVWRFLTGKKATLSTTQKKELQTRWQQVINLAEPTKKILEAEKVFTTAWRYRGVTGTFAQQWKQVGYMYSNEQAVWNAHKVRNRIVHEPNAQASVRDATMVVEAYGKVLTPMFV